MSFASVQDLAERLGTTFDPTDLKAIRALEDATALIQTYTQQVFTEVPDDEVALNGSGTRALVLPQLPVTDVTDVSLLAEDGTETALESADYRLLGTEGILVRLSRSKWGWWTTWPEGYANVAVTYSHGYATIPAPIKAACVEIAARLQASLVAAGSSGPVSGETLGGYQVAYTSTGQTVSSYTGLTADECALVDPYRQADLV